MASITRTRLRLAGSSALTSLRTTTTTTTHARPAPARILAASAAAAIHHSSSQSAKVEPGFGNGPPPQPPSSSSTKPAGGNEDPARAEAAARIARRLRQADMLRQAKDIRAIEAATLNYRSSGSHHQKTRGAGGALKKRFWKDVTVNEVDGALQIHLDTRPLRHPSTREIIRLPPSKHALAAALAVEWDSLRSAQDATRQHLIPLTSLTCRAIDFVASDSADQELRKATVESLLRYLDTDSLLCWAAPVDPSDADAHASAVNDDGYTLREVQEDTARKVLAVLTADVWPGVAITPVLTGESIVPRAQPAGTREVIQGWVWGLSGFELAGLERATLAGKSLLTAARLVVEWSEEGAGRVVGGSGSKEEGKRFGAEEASRAVSVEVDWQTANWGQVEDTHDVDCEDVRRQMGGVVLLVSGTGKRH
ncbi:hypothetical protein QBC47DRAFT_411202 [Echria macrotheca]|uniref:Uncharacterized protein n=1 Tax=Echria macrotheca TaxID=438768 RepID=A0AAJ0BHR3_9PEZI|nr:hypothetical protein QBC47DRAFT_411202 [Echria macrotheca]